MPDQRRNAGNIGDVIKHAILPAVVTAFGDQQSCDWNYYETHSGFYVYPLSLLKGKDGWRGERAWSVGIVEASAEFQSLGHYGRVLRECLSAGIYPGSMRIIESLAERRIPSCLYGWDIGEEQIDSYRLASQRLTVVKGDGYEQVRQAARPADLIFCDPFWNSPDEATRAETLLREHEVVVVWYPLSRAMTAFRGRLEDLGIPRIEVSFTDWCAGDGWAGQDQRGAGLALKGLSREALEDALAVASSLQQVFSGGAHSGKPRKGKDGTTVIPRDRDLSLEIQTHRI